MVFAYLFVPAPALPPRHEGNNTGRPPLPQSATHPSAIQGNQPAASDPAPEMSGGKGTERRLRHNSQPQRTPALRRLTARPTPLAASPGLHNILSRARQAPYPTRAQAIDERNPRLVRTTGPLTSSTSAVPSVPSAAPAPAALSAAPAAAAATPSAPAVLAAARPIQGVVVEEMRRLTYVAWGTPGTFTQGSGILLRSESVATRIVSQFGQSG
ncbi:hypothetical protein FRC12_023263 [Ceratobasidium sp. 428]|nr:hypothetical protein FRC12_023263 [Ceratobasidium sp. 428]